MIKNITKNLGTKIFCVTVALFLWVYVAAGQSTVGKFPGKIKIKAVNIASGLEAVYDLKTVEVKVMADSATWKKLSADSFSAHVDLSSRTVGTYEVPVTVSSNVPGATIVEKDPEKIFVRLEPIVSKEIEVNAKIEGSAAEGMMAGDIAFTPSTVLARGPKSIMENTNEVWARIKLDNEEESFSKNVSVFALDENNSEISGIEFTPNEVRAEVSITRASNNKTVGVRVITSGNPKPGFFVSQIVSTPSVVDVVGSKSIIDNINYIETMPLDITGLSSDVEKELTLNLKNGVVLQSGSPNAVKVRVKFSQTELTREMIVGITAKNLLGYAVTGYSSSEIRAIVTGQSEIVKNLKNGDIVLELNFSGKTFQDVVNFSLSTGDFRVPGGVTIIGFLPSSVNAYLRRE